MAPHRPTLSLLAPIVCAALAMACADRPSSPAIALTYNWGDPGLVDFLQAEVDRVAPAGAPRIRIVDGREIDFIGTAPSLLAAEVDRAAHFSRDPSVIVAVGPGGSREALQVAPVYRRAGLAHLVPTATSRLLAGVGDWAFLMAPNDSLQGEFIGAFVDTALKARRAAILYVPDEYGVGLAAGTAATLAARGIDLVARIPIRATVLCSGASDRAHYRRIVNEIAAQGTPDVVVTALRSVECACALAALRERWPRVHVVTGDGAYVDRELITRARGGAEGNYFVAFWHPKAGTTPADFVDRFRAATGRAPRHGDAVFYDGVMLAARAIREAGADRARVRDYLRSLGIDRPAYDGIAGPVAFTPAIRRELLMTQVADGDVRVVGAR